MGAEALLAHRLYRVLAEQLEQSGFTVLRFDYGGTGDSSGGPECTSITAWTEDIVTAADELSHTVPASRLVVAGVRLGATLAALASARLALRSRQLVLWDPVIEGLAYLRELAAAHRTFMDSELRHITWQNNLEVDNEGVPTEALGMSLPPTLLTELRNIDLSLELPRTDHITVLCTKTSESAKRFRDALTGYAGLRWLDIDGSENWNCDAALNAATVPMDIIREIVAGIQAVNP